MNVFDRQAKLLQRERAARNPDVAVFDYLKEEVSIKRYLIRNYVKQSRKSSSSKVCTHTCWYVKHSYAFFFVI